MHHYKYSQLHVHHSAHSNKYSYSINNFVFLDTILCVCMLYVVELGYLHEIICGLTNLLFATKFNKKMVKTNNMNIISVSSYYYRDL